ncbi:MAG: UDP-glycosyltransferase [Flavobacteriaceae bacterium]|nr:UDP-glycosyltransferase [Flavobacteriaceae bacterium]
MALNSKILLLLPDGVGLRNFVYSDFINLGKNRGIETVLWNSTPFDLKGMEVKEIQLQGKPSLKTDLLKRARINIQLKTFELQTGNSVFSSYRFPPATKTLKQKIKNGIVWYYSKTYQNNLSGLRNKLQQSERKTPYYKACLATLKKEQPAMLFCTNQRPVNAIAPLTAAQDLGIPTATFIFSWDNLPKATMVVETDYYFVWSTHMKAELLFYYPYIKEQQIIISGTPQFEFHFDPALKQTKNAFCNENNLNVNKRYLCFSGDDITTSPHDPFYLEETAKTVRKINTDGGNWHILFRRCPVDFSNRYDNVLSAFKNEITALPPVWKQVGDQWNTVMPTPEDNDRLLNTVAHSELIVNVGSSMVFDGLCHEVPTAYINYNPMQEPVKKDIHSIYKYIHFQSMPKEPPVYWLNKPTELQEILTNLDHHKKNTIEAAQTWFQTINQHPPQKASERIWEGIEKILKY